MWRTGSLEPLDVTSAARSTPGCESLAVGVPAALLIDFDFPSWHTAEDTLDKVSAKSLAIVGDVVLDALPSVEQRLAGR
jgi:Zn-dependent M28 family amino/carboxypeptidase